MKKSGYMDRALRSNDPRFARVLGKLGYQRSDMVAVKQPDEIAVARAEYERVVGKRPFMGWDAATLREKIAEAQKPADKPAKPNDADDAGEIAKGAE